MRKTIKKHNIKNREVRKQLEFQATDLLSMVHTLSQFKFIDLTGGVITTECVENLKRQIPSLTIDY